MNKRGEDDMKELGKMNRSDAVQTVYFHECVKKGFSRLSVMSYATQRNTDDEKYGIWEQLIAIKRGLC